MHQPRRLHVVIELTLGGSDIQGVLTAENGASTSFTGLLGLFAALEAARAGATAPTRPDITSC
jgi:hypothetical protein